MKQYPNIVGRKTSLKVVLSVNNPSIEYRLKIGFQQGESNCGKIVKVRLKVITYNEHKAKRASRDDRDNWVSYVVALESTHINTRTRGWNSQSDDVRDTQGKCP